MRDKYNIWYADQMENVWAFVLRRNQAAYARLVGRVEEVGAKSGKS